MDDFNNRENNPFESGSGNWKPLENDDNTLTENARNQEVNENGNQPFDYGIDQTTQSSNPTEQKKPQGFAIASMVLGIVGLVFVNCCCLCLGFIASAILAFIIGGTGLVFGVLTLVKNGKNGMAIAGIVTCAITLLYAISFLGLSFVSKEFLEEWMKEIEEMYPGIFDEYSDLYPGGGYDDI